MAANQKVEQVTKHVLFRTPSMETPVRPCSPPELSDSSDDEKRPPIPPKLKDGKSASMASLTDEQDYAEPVKRHLDDAPKVPQNFHKMRHSSSDSDIYHGDLCPPEIVISKSSDEIFTKSSMEAKNEFSIEDIKMASPRPKSPRPAVVRKDEKEESFWDKIGTIGRKKKIKEVQEVQHEGKRAIDSPGSPTTPDIPPEAYWLEENGEWAMIVPKSYEDPKFLELTKTIIDWINDVLASERIIVKNIEEDLYDGQILHKLLEKLTNTKLDVPEVTQSEEGQKEKLRVIIARANQVLGNTRWPAPRWNVESIHSKNIVPIMRLLVALARHFRAPIRLPENVSVEVVIAQKRDGQLIPRQVVEQLTGTYDDVGVRGERDAFDTLLDHAPDKLQVVKKSLIIFVNKHLSKLSLEVTDLDNQFADGVFLVLLMGLLEGYCVPLYSFRLTPQDKEQKVANVMLAFELMQDAGLPKPKARPEDIVNVDLKSTLRVLYNLFFKFKNLG